MRAIHKRFDGLFLWAVTAIVFPAAFVWGGARLLAQLPSPSAAVSAAEECPAAFPLEGIALRGEEPLFLPADALLIPSDGERLPAGALLARLPDGEERRCTRPCVFFTGSDGLETLSPPELSADVIEQGITLTGGGALLRGMDKLINRETGMPVYVAEYPLDCVAEGTGKIIENLEDYEELLAEEIKYY